jgi:hypothetical protein
MIRDDNPAKVAIIQEWDAWSKTHFDNTGGKLFFQHLQHRRLRGSGFPDLYKVENWTKDGAQIEHILYAGDNLDKAREIFTAVIKHRPGIRLTIRQRTRVLDKWPRE